MYPGAAAAEPCSLRVDPMSSSPPDAVLVRYAEIGLKDRNRPRFERKFRDNLDRRTGDLPRGRIERLQGGIWIELAPDTPLEVLRDRLITVPGVAWFAPGWRVQREPDAVARRVLDVEESHRPEASSFAVRTQRSDKSLELTSVDFNRRIGERVESATGLSVDLDDPDWEIHVQLLHDRGHLSFRRYEGIGGLPAGVNGTVLGLLSGGLDSPVASVQCMKRGCEVDLLHFYAYPDAQHALDAKISELAARLADFQNGATLHLAPYHPFDLAVRGVEPRLELVLFRRHTLRVAERMAADTDRRALVTGESLGQVASQTLENLTTIDAATDMTVLRPLIGLNKNEIVALARRYGTYETSIRGYRDCCAIQDAHPMTTSHPDRLRRLEEKHDLTAVDTAVLDEVETHTISSPDRGAAPTAAES